MIRTFPGALNRPVLPVTLAFCFAQNGLSLQALPLNWNLSKIINAAIFHIIGLTKIIRIEFLPLDWICRGSIRIMTVTCIQYNWREPAYANSTLIS